MKSRNYIGNVYKNLTVLDQKREGNRTYLLCKCSVCGKEDWYRQDYFKSSNRKFCCTNNTKFVRQNHSGEIINNIEFLNQTSKKRDTSYLYKCRCFCGNIFYATYAEIRSRKVKSCGCLKIYRPKNLEKAIKKYKDSYIKENTNLKTISNNKLYSNNKSGVKGVFYSTKENKWIANLRIKGANFKKRFNTKAEAINYRKELENKYFKPILSKYKKLD